MIQENVELWNIIGTKTYDTGVFYPLRISGNLKIRKIENIPKN